MRIEVKGRNGATVDEELISRLEKKLAKVDRQVSPLAVVEVELSEERNPAIRDSQVAEATLQLKGMTLRAKESSTDMGALDQPHGGRPGAPGQEAPRQAPRAPRGAAGGRAAAPPKRP